MRSGDRDGKIRFDDFESRISIAAALHAALPCPATRYLDLDGSLDLARDVAERGFALEDGLMRTTSAPGPGGRRPTKYALTGKLRPLRMKVTRLK